MASFLIGAGGNYLTFALTRLVKVFEVSATEVAWLTESGQNVVAKGTGFSVVTVNGAPVLSGSITSFEVFSPSGGFLLSVNGINLPVSDATNAFSLGQLLAVGDDVLAKVDSLPVRFFGGEGIDVVDYTTASAAVGVNLAPGNERFNTGPARGDSYSSIEGAIGSRFNDFLAGDFKNNKLWGGEGHDSLAGNAGNDSLYGGGGNDLLNGGSGVDAFDGGSGIDTVDYSAETGSVTVNLGNNAFNGGQAAGETYVSIENVIGSQYGDSLIGDNNRNTLSGSFGDDFIFGLGGDDRINGDDGNDQLNGGAGNDTMSGGAGDDTLVGEAGVDRFEGGSGFDFVSYFNATGAVTVNLGLNSLNGGQAAGETYTSVEGVFGSRFSDNIVGDNNANALFGGDGADVLFGLDGSDVVKGDGGADRLNGGWGEDTIEGGAGNDTLTGETGADRFVFGTAWGHDQITDYQRGIDQKLDFTGVAGLDNFSQLAITSSAAGALVAFAGNTLLLAGVHGSALTSSDFML